MPVQSAEREYIHSKVGECHCDCAASVITLPFSCVWSPVHASLHTEGVKGKCQPIASHLSASGPIPADSDYLLCQVNVR